MQIRFIPKWRKNSSTEFRQVTIAKRHFLWKFCSKQGNDKKRRGKNIISCIPTLILEEPPPLPTSSPSSLVGLLSERKKRPMLRERMNGWIQSQYTSYYKGVRNLSLLQQPVKGSERAGSLVSLCRAFRFLLFRFFITRQMQGKIASALKNFFLFNLTSFQSSSIFLTLQNLHLNSSKTTHKHTPHPPKKVN